MLYHIVIIVFYILTYLSRCLCSVGLPTGAGAPSVWWAGEEQEETGGWQQIYTGEPGKNGEEQEWTGRPHQKVKDTHTSVIDAVHDECYCKLAKQNRASHLAKLFSAYTAKNSLEADIKFLC